MKTQLIAALLISGALIASPAFAGNSALDAPFTSFQGVSTSPDASANSRAEARLELADTAQARTQTQSVASQAVPMDPSSATAAPAPVARSIAPAEGNGLMDRERP